MKQVLVLLSGIVFIFTSCQKELSDTKKPSTSKNESVFALFESKQPAAQVFTVNNTTSAFVMGSKGTRIILPPNAFVSPAGGPVTGNVTIELKEIYSITDMVLNNKFTQAGDQPLESGGVFFIRARLGTQELRLAPGKTLTARLPTNMPLSGMQVYNGTTVNVPDTTPAGTNFFTWQLNANTNINNVTAIQDSLTGYNYVLQADALEWINVDRLVSGALVPFQVHIAGNYEKKGVLMHITGMKSIVQLWNPLMARGPEVQVTLIGFALNGDQLYTRFLPVTIQNGQTYIMDLQPTTEAQFIQQLNNLN